MDYENLENAVRDRIKQLQKEKIAEVSQVFLLTVDEQGSVCCIKKEGKL